MYAELASRNETEREKRKVDALKMGFAYDDFFISRLKFYVCLKHFFPLSCKCHSEKWFEGKWSANETKAKAKETGKFNIQTFETLSVAHFAYLDISHKQLALRYVTLLQRALSEAKQEEKKRMKGKRKKRRNRGEISISINTVVQMNPFVGEI